MKRTCSIATFVLFSLFLFLPFAQATFPGKSIAHWDLEDTQESHDPKYLKMHELVKEKKYSEALNILNEKIANFPKTSTPLILKALILNEMEKYGEALDLIMKGSRLQARHPAVHFAFCQVYRNLGNIELSQRACLISVEKHRDFPESHYEYAQTLIAQGRMKEAMKELQTAATLAPKNPQYPYELGMISNYLNQPEDAEKFFQTALSLDPENLDALYETAYIYAAQNKPEMAKKYILKILETRREHPKVNSAKILMDYVNKNALEKLTLHTTPHLYHLSRSQSLFQSGKYGLSLIEIQTAARLKPDDLEIQEILIGMCSVLFRLDIAEKTIHNFLAMTKGNDVLSGKAYQELGDIRVIQGKLKEALEYYEKAQTLGDPGNLAKITLAQFPDVSEGDSSLQNPNELFFKPTDALNRKGEIFAHYKMYDRAIAIYGMVVRMDPQHLSGTLNTATAYFQNGNHGRTISILERLLVTQPSHDFILAHRFLLAQAYVKKGDTQGGLKNIKWILKRSPEMKSQIKENPVFKNLQENKDFLALVQ